MSSQEVKLRDLLESFDRKLPKFPDGRINYLDSPEAPVLSVTLVFGNKFLLLKRSEVVSNYKGLWNVVSGFLDEIRPIQDKVEEELREELSLDQSLIKGIKLFPPIRMEDPKIGKTWIINPVLVELKSEPQIKLDIEHTDFAWITLDKLDNYETPPGLKESLRKMLAQGTQEVLA